VLVVPIRPSLDRNTILVCKQSSRSTHAGHLSFGRHSVYYSCSDSVNSCFLFEYNWQHGLVVNVLCLLNVVACCTQLPYLDG